MWVFFVHMGLNTMCLLILMNRTAVFILYLNLVYREGCEGGDIAEKYRSDLNQILDASVLMICRSDFNQMEKNT